MFIVLLKYSPPARTPDCFAVVLLVQAGNLVDERQRFAAAEVAAVDVKVAGMAQVVLFAADIRDRIQSAVPEHVQRMQHRAAHSGEQGKHQHRRTDEKQCPHGLPPAVQVAHKAEHELYDAEEDRHAGQHRDEPRHQLGEVLRRAGDAESSQQVLKLFYHGFTSTRSAVP